MNKKYILLLLPLLLLGCQKTNGDLSQQENNYIRLESSKETYYSFSKNSYERKYFMPSVGDSNILVVPLIIKGYEVNATKENKERIENAFFGDYSSTGFE